jgi:DNA repair protein RAD7
MITDGFLVDSIMPQCSLLSSITLEHLPELTDAGVGLFFNDWNGNPLCSLSLGRNPTLGSEALEAVLNHSGNVLQELNINGWKGVPEASLMQIAAKCPKLEQLDVGWCREVDDFVVKSIIDGCPDLKVAKVWGCNRLTVACPKRVSLLFFECLPVTDPKFRKGSVCMV